MESDMVTQSERQDADTLGGAIILSAIARTQKIVIAGVLAVYEMLTGITHGARTLTGIVSSNA